MCDARRLRWHFVRMIIIVIPGFVSVRMLFNDPSSRNKEGSLFDLTLLFLEVSYKKQAYDNVSGVKRRG